MTAEELLKNWHFNLNYVIRVDSPREELLEFQNEVTKDLEEIEHKIENLGDKLNENDFNMVKDLFRDRERMYSAKSQLSTALMDEATKKRLDKEFMELRKNIIKTN